MRLAALLSLLVVPIAGCGDDGDCGPGEAPADGLTITSGGESFRFGEATSSPNNDCPVEGAPTSLTVEIAQVDPAPVDDRFFVLCLPRPDQIGGEPIELTDERIQVIDIFVDDDGCLISLDRSREVSGTATFSGFCGDGSGESGYALGFAATVPGTRSCAGMPEEAVELELSGELAVTAIQI